MSTGEWNALAFPMYGMRLIEASAGTGKTYTIANLYLRLLLGLGRERPLSVDNILVVTFTTAATEELRERVRQRIVLAYDGFRLGASDDGFIAGLIAAFPEKGTACSLLDAAQRQMDEASIYTIHGFCHRALTDNAFTSGAAFELELIIDETLLQQQAAEDFWRQQLATLDPDTASLLPPPWKSPESLLRAVIPYWGSQQLRLEPEANWSGDELVSLRAEVEALKALWLEQDVSRLLRELPFKARAKVRDEARIREMERFCRSNRLEFVSSRGESWELWSPQAIKAATPKAQQVPVHRAFDYCGRLARAFADLRQQLHIHLLTRAIGDIAASMRQSRQERNQLSPDDLLQNLAAALQRPGSGAQLGQRLARQYPVAMVDEFQDTDALQYRIFDAIYGASEATAWLMIGDPKQAIYKFRGADIFTYIGARRRVAPDPHGLFSLATNWRSSSAMVEAVNRLFQRAEALDPGQGAFLYPDDIPFTPVQASPDADSKPMRLAGKVPVPLKLFYCRGEDKKGRISSGAARQILAQKTASQIVELLNAATDGLLTIAGQALTPGNIAVLVRERSEAGLVKDALAQRGVNSVFLSRESVFDAPVAIDLYHLLQAVLHPGDGGKLRSALATRLLDVALADIAALDEDMQAQQGLLEEFADYRQQLQRFGVLSMLRQLMARRNLPARLLAQPEGQRSLTDLRHLGELLQQASESGGGPEELLRWFLRHLRGERRADSDSQRVRLESDDKLVQIVTIHASKGLEYDVVFIPLASFARQSTECVFHRQHGGEGGEEFVTVADLATSPESQKLTDRERLAEDIRLLYVALTRARHQCYLGLANVAGRKPVLPFADTAVAHLLGSPDVAADETALLESLHSLALDCGDKLLSLEVFSPDHAADVTTVRWPPARPVSLALREPPRLARDNWSLTSYSALARGQGGSAPQRGAADEQEQSVSGIDVGDEASPATFPRGPRYGTLLHNILETVDFAADEQSLLAATRHQLDAFGMDNDRWAPMVASWLRQVLNSQLPPLNGLSLAELPAAARISEMEFNFRMSADIRGADLDYSLRRSGYLGHSPPLDFAAVRGIMRGFIDLVFQHQGRFYLLDYKSNYLGPNPDSYRLEAMQRAIGTHRYDLQYLIYATALHRYLGARLRDYSFESHFGGVYYLFLRGMTGRSEPGRGVFYDRPDRGTILALDTLFDAGEGG